MKDLLVSRWNSRNGVYYVDLYRDSVDRGYRYIAGHAPSGHHDAVGYFRADSDDQAILIMEKRVNDFQPDINKTSMKRINV